MYNHPWPEPRVFAGFADTAAVSVTMRYAPLGFLLALSAPVLVVDGQALPARWGVPVVTTVGAGQHHVHVHVPYPILRRIGAADLTVVAPPGRTVEIEYRAPLLVFLRGAIGAGRQRTPGRFLVLALVLVLGLLAGAAAVVARPSGSPAAPASAVRTAPPLPGLPSVAPTLPIVEEPPDRRLTGAVFGAADETSTMRFAGWPFSFRVPAAWECAETAVEIAGAQAYICVAGKRRLALMLRACVAPCDAATRNRMTGIWFRDGEKPRRFDEATQFLEVREKYQLVMSHFFDADGTTWQIALDATAPVKRRAEVQKAVNDILTRT
ncbi:hypothetical protein AB0M02_45675 [Actinoplanes sp. NPDC051861]|uniref:hypothetical protein n=1 Tax=Actinoplanes sp. NPDC051861 TaxID=3155170 RepID=UPI0034180231